MRRLLNSSEKRRLKLIEMLYFFNSPIKKYKILYNLNSKENTLRADVDYLNEKYAKIFNIVLNSNEIRIIFFDNQGLSAVYEEFLTNFTVFNLAESIFFNKFNSIDELASHIYTSPSTVYRVIEKFNKVAITEYKVNIDTRTVSFTGCEKDIRNFFIQLFSEKYTYLDWPFDNIDKNVIQRLILNFVNIFNMNFSYSELETFALICAVNASRYLNGFEIEKIETNQLSIDNYQKYFVESNTSGKLLKDLESLGPDSSPKCLYNIFHNFLCKDFIYNYDYFLKLSSISKQSYNLEKSVNLLFEIVNDLIDEFNIPRENIEDLVIKLHNERILFNTKPRSNYIFFNANKLFINKLKINFDKIVTSVVNKIENYLLEINGHINLNEVNNLAYYLFSTWTGLIPTIIKSTSKVQVLVASFTNFDHSIVIKDCLEALLPTFVEVDLYNDQIFDLENVDNENYDFIITDFTIHPKNGPKWKYFHGNQGYKDIINISNDIYKRFFEKNKQS